MGALDPNGLAAIRGALGELGRNLRRPDYRQAIRTELELLPTAIVRTLPTLLRSKGETDASLLRVIQENAQVDPFGLAFEMGDERYTWGALDDRTSQVAHVLAASGVKKGDVVALLGKNSPLYLAIIFGINRVGATAALINNHLSGEPLSHAIRVSGAKVLVVEKESAERVHARAELKSALSRIFTFNFGDFEDRLAEAPARAFPRVPVQAKDDFVYIYTSGTTGLPKPCPISHARSLAAAASFGPLFFGFRPGDKLYNVLPLYHSSGLLLGTGGCILTRTPMAMRPSFSASAFWSDVQRYRATALIYIGELCRYLVNSPPSPAEKNNPIRIALGNGLRPDVWGPFQKRFDIPMIREFYAATEAPGIIMNLSNREGSVGRVPMRRFSAMRLIRFDVDTETHLRDENGLCIECRANEAGELVVRLDDEPRSAASEFRGYTDKDATERKIIRDVFEKGDRYYRSGDLLRYDEENYFYFVDRIGDTYRWKGENVSTAEVADVITQVPGVLETTVCGIHVPGMEGQAGLAAVVCENGFDAGKFWQITQELPQYAQPRFVRVIEAMSTTATFKIQKTTLRKDGIDPVAQSGRIYLRQDTGYVPLTPDLWQRVTSGQERL